MHRTAGATDIAAECRCSPGAARTSNLSGHPIPDLTEGHRSSVVGESRCEGKGGTITRSADLLWLLGRDSSLCGIGD